jgi:transcriptional regulator GlxA family with amidase domain
MQDQRKQAGYDGWGFSATECNALYSHRPNSRNLWFPRFSSKQRRSRLFRVWDWNRLAKEADFHPAKMAALCSVSQRQLQRFFETHLHTTPRRWLHELRCEIAKRLISRGYSNKAVSFELKYSNEANFCREFKTVYGAPPQSFAPGFGNTMSLADNNVAE